MLNPRNYLEDCVRYGKFSLWTSGFPWKAIDDCIDNDTFEYNASAEARQRFEETTKHAWDSRDDKPVITLECPKCKNATSSPWTTCDSRPMWIHKPGKFGVGFTEKLFEAWCQHCGFLINHDVQRATRFRKDVERLLSHACPMPGTFLDKHGMYRCMWKWNDIPITSRCLGQGNDLDS